MTWSQFATLFLLCPWGKSGNGCVLLSLGEAAGGADCFPPGFIGLCSDLRGLLGGSVGTGGASASAATGAMLTDLPWRLGPSRGLLSMVFLRGGCWVFEVGLPPQMIPLSVLLLVLRSRSTSVLELLRLRSGVDASVLLKSRANALLACSNGLTGDFVARCNDCVRSRSPVNIARLLANDAALSLDEAAGTGSGCF